MFRSPFQADIFSLVTLLVVLLSASSTSPATISDKSGKPLDRAGKQYNRYYLHSCSRSDPSVNECLTESANNLAQYFKRGIPELGIGNVEPIIIDEIHLSLGSGPNGYRATFRDINAYGVSNLTVIGARSDLSTNQFQFTFYVPKISVRGHYRSSGVLIMVPATGGGEYWGEYGKLDYNLQTSLQEFWCSHHGTCHRRRSSGVLIMVPATGGGEYWGEY
ncbi:uncharacterized protein LOC103518801, partial [Diaphorina citri]|uniref:Uncharacterized protein LOC103518801 n=1 Tax=Diaphorina citri TaxID=121845 RepID=A0A1S3DI34_DIACI